MKGCDKYDVNVDTGGVDGIIEDTMSTMSMRMVVRMMPAA